MTITLSSHALSRLKGRFKNIVSLADVERAVNSVGHFNVGETAIRIREFYKPIRLVCEDGSLSMGDTVYVVYRRSDKNDVGTVTTIELRHHKQGLSPRWSYLVEL